MGGGGGGGVSLHPPTPLRSAIHIYWSMKKSEQASERAGGRGGGGGICSSLILDATKLFAISKMVLVGYLPSSQGYHVTQREGVTNYLKICLWLSYFVLTHCFVEKIDTRVNLFFVLIRLCACHFSFVDSVAVFVTQLSMQSIFMTIEQSHNSYTALSVY